MQLVERRGAPPHVVWITWGNVSDAELRAIALSAGPRVRQVPSTLLERSVALSVLPDEFTALSDWREHILREARAATNEANLYRL